MPKSKKIVQEVDDIEEYQEYEQIEEPVQEEPVKISKRTGKPVRPLSDKQKEILARGRQLAIKNKQDIGRIAYTKKKNEIIKEETMKAREIRQAKLKEDKEKAELELEETRNEIIEPKKTKKVKKKVIKYVESSDSDDSSDGEIIVKKKKNHKKEVENNNIVDDRAVYNLKNKLLNDRLDEMARLLMPQ